MLARGINLCSGRGRDRIVPQIPRFPSALLFDDQRIFANALQCHWHVSGAIGVDEEARQQFIALDQQLYQFSHRMEEREL